MKRWGLLGTFVLVLSVALWSSWLVSQEREVTLRYKFPRQRNANLQHPPYGRNGYDGANLGTGSPRNDFTSGHDDAN